ncbi:hypothetical protein Acsp05_07800 [Actinokineospora sp. NBRC 105648]|nr:hypothetical protein Acsp05_07800 [Actinokineospora sp. NBRC 105648]
MAEDRPAPYFRRRQEPDLIVAVQAVDDMGESGSSAPAQEISSRSANVNIPRTTGNPSPPHTTITCYDRA